MTDFQFAAHALIAELFFAVDDGETTAEIDQRIHDVCGLDYPYLAMLAQLTTELSVEIEGYTIMREIDTLSGYEEETLQALSAVRRTLYKLKAHHSYLRNKAVPTHRIVNGRLLIMN